MSKGRYYQGIYTPKFPEKWITSGAIVYRSGWEKRFFQYCDNTPAVLKVASEELIIPYLSPVDGMPHRYFPDLWIQVQTNTGIKTLLIEIKPRKQTLPPQKPKRKSQRFIQESATYAINTAKWDAARRFCKEKGWEFVIITETELFNKVKK